MQFICELVPSAFLTPLRRAIAHELGNREYTQIEIAQILGVSQPVVSTYLKSSSPVLSPIIARSAFQNLVANLVTRITEQNSTFSDDMEIVCQECQSFRTAGPLCDLHRKESKIEFPVDCNLCFPSQEMTSIFDQKLLVIKELYDSAQQLVQSGKTFGNLIPEIGCQFIYILDDSQNPDNIVGFPGRIVNVKGTGRIVSFPEFGQGATLAQILLNFKKRGSPYRALISLRRTEEILTIIEAKKSILLTFEGDLDWNQAIKQLPLREFQQIEVIADSGGVGLEPIIYLFGTTPSEIVSFLLSTFKKIED